MTSATLEDLREKTLKAHTILCETYGAPFPFFRDVDPLTELVGSMLSHRTRNADSGRALLSLETRFRRWEAVRDAPVKEVEEAIKAATWPEQKAPRIQGALRLITEERGELSLDFLGEMEVGAARGWLERLPGVGPKTSAAVLLFSRLRMPAMPVDSHHHRVAARLGLIPEGVGPGAAHDELRALLPADWSAQALYDHHEALMYHGQKCCFYKNPACKRCPVLFLCPYGRERLGDEKA